jgi:hypothetical protein
MRDNYLIEKLEYCRVNSCWNNTRDSAEEIISQLTRAQQLEARVMELEQILLDASKLVRTRLCDHCEDHRAEGNCPQDEVDECWEYQLFKRIDDIL